MSPRYKKPRKCNCPFEGKEGLIYKPCRPDENSQPVIIFRDELETMRLCDLDGLSQEEAGYKMGVSRGTVQRLLKSARRKIIKAILEQRALCIKREDGA